MAPSSRPLSPGPLRLGGILFLVLGLVLPALFVVLGVRSADEEASRPQVEGVVVANIAHHDRSRSRGSRNKPTFRPRVDYVVAGETYTYTSSSGSRPPKYDVGEKVMISYDRDRPEVAHIVGSQRTMFKVLAGSFLVAFGGAAIVFFVLASRVQKNWAGKARTRVGPPTPSTEPTFTGRRGGTVSYPASYPTPPGDQASPPVRVAQARLARFLPIIVPLALGLVVSAIAGALMYSMHSFEQRAVRVPGVVTQLENDQGTFHPIVTYEYKGVERTFRSPSGSKPPAYEKGQNVTLLIDPDLSSEVRIEGSGKIAVKVVLAVGLTLVLLGLVLVGVRVVKRRDRAIA